LTHRGRHFESLPELPWTSDPQALIGVNDDPSFNPEHPGIERTIVEVVL
jgi:hypothetical protein